MGAKRMCKTEAQNMNKIYEKIHCDVEKPNMLLSRALPKWHEIISLEETKPAN
jgi:hypothetical protein